MHPARELSSLISRQLRALDRLLALVHRRPEPGPIHDLRVLTRRLRSMAWLAGRIGAAAREFRRRLRKAGRALSVCRALDVALEDSVRVGEEDTIGEPLRRLRIQAALAVRKATSPDRRRKIARSGRLLSNALARIQKSEFRGISDKMEELARTGRSLSSRTSKDRLHRFRIEVKKCRYVLETLRILRIRRPEDPRQLRRIQSELGRAHDLETLRRYCRTLSPGRRFPWLATQLRQERLHVARALRRIRRLQPVPKG